MSTATDFDFLFRDWTVHHRKLKTRLAGANDWVEFSGTSTTRPVLGGEGNIEDNVLHDPGGTYRAIAVRSFDAQSKVWRIWWLDLRTPGDMGTPVLGRFDGGTGIFIADDTWRGAHIKMRFTWQKTAGLGPRWEQAFSADGGKTWEDNWIMEFSPLSIRPRS